MTDVTLQQAGHGLVICDDTCRHMQDGAQLVLNAQERLNVTSPVTSGDITFAGFSVPFNFRGVE